MAYLETKDLTFTYALSPKVNLDSVNIQIEKGEFVLMFGETGSGKSTLLKLLKSAIRPEGELTGELLFRGKNLLTLTRREDTTKIGYVSQSPDHQIVTDKVWHELAFTLENLGVGEEEIRRRVAEMAVFFGITDWFERSVNELSGGQKQILNLAAVMIAQPELVLLDEPTSQLDPIATENFIALLKRVNDEFGTTILLSEHRLDEALSRADRCIVLHQAKLLYCGDREGMVKTLMEQDSPLIKFLPSQTSLPMKLCSRFDSFTIKEGKKIMEKRFLKERSVVDDFTHFESKRVSRDNTQAETNTKMKYTPKHQNSPIVWMKNVWFRYEREGKDILKDFELKIYAGDYISFLGANGQGKTTLLSLLTGLEKPYRGKIIFEKESKRNQSFRRKISMLPQNPQDLFLKPTVEEELRNIEYEFEPYAKEFMLEDLLKKHPYDLSGGQQQLLALAKVVMTKPEILLLDEPTKGVDQLLKQRIAKIIRNLHEQGTTIVIVSHDIEFCAQNTQISYFLYDGMITQKAPTKQLLSRNYFYTSTANKMMREVDVNLVLEDEVVEYAREH
ncbi:MAG: ATP-binding cassette domain-containing protein [Clostridiales bacterium]|nr:ATP-binding cassette domain-containing protein [Clostridiales bacterium]